MIEMPNKPIVFFDCDDTLILYEFTEEDLPKTITMDLDSIYQQRVLPCEENIQELKKLKALGRTIVLWSQAGAAWSATVARALNLEAYVDITMGKPDIIFDDLPSSDWMPQRVHKRKGY